MEIENSELEAEIKKRERFGSCEVCNKNQAKYTCPRCELHTCSLNCSKIHKKELECNGIRDKTKYIPLSKMTAMDFMNDYYFLEEATRFTKDVKTNSNVKNSKKLSAKFYKLKNAAKARNIRLFFVNSSLSKRRKNFTDYDSKEDIISWYVEFNFLNASFKTFVKVNENKKIEDEIKDIMSKNEDVKQLDFYRAQENKFRVLLKAEGTKKNQNRYYRVNIRKSLKSNLALKTIIEYPTIYVVLDHSSDDFDIISSDDETVIDEQKDFTKTLKEEVFTKKIGNNPLFVVAPEEIPIISDILNEENRKIENEKQKQLQEEKKLVMEENNATLSDEDNEVLPENYFFNN